MRLSLGIVLALLLLCPLGLYAQKTKTVSGEYIYYPPESQSMEAAKRTAEERAKLQLIADTFGTMVSSSAFTQIRNDRSGSESGTHLLSESTVKGEWLETTSGPFFNVTVGPDGMLAITVTIAGKIREITADRTELDVRILRNGITNRHESVEFKDGDNMYLSFKSPQSGWIAIYLYDGSESVYRLLPYSRQADASYRVKGDLEYIFFCTECAPLTERDNVDEYSLNCERATEINHVWCVFSPNGLVKAIDSASENNQPRMLSITDFQRWLAKITAKDRQASIWQTDIIINK